jgi:hypothetical protein
MRDKYRWFIPTRDSARWIGTILDFYLSRGLAPLVVIDARTVDNTRELVASRGLSFLEFTPRGEFPEAGMLEFAAQNAEADWVLRLDDDELPSKGLIDFVREPAAKSKNQCWFIERRELYREGRRVVFSRSPGKYPLPDYPQYLQPMARLYHVDRVRFLEEVHTTGFGELKLYGFAPRDAFMIHLNCLMHDFDLRLNKLIGYEQSKPGVSWGLADEYLPELFDAGFHNSSAAGLEEFGDILEYFAPHKPPSIQQLARVDLDFARTCVAARINSLMEARARSNGALLSADEVSWIEYMPTAMRLPLAEFLCGLSNRKLRRVGVALWDYLALHAEPHRTGAAARRK